MKHKLRSISGLLLLLSLVIVSCKKDKIPAVPKDVLTGAWEETPQKAYSRRLLFATGGQFSMQIRDQNNQYWQMEVIGKYTISGDRLIVNTASNLEKSATGKIITNTPVNYILFDSGKFSIDQHKLTIHYTTYPADAPVATMAVFNQLIAID
ncbi:hypothetical protein [Pedobacter sp. MR22-3]|uniref:hypothetical protein n=1 Tax=Pedobacter sp. MR22-3 TaxID=2994552 RepID=UPI0022478FF9|nr:hypothetical protein [Pedobacter sp. MR22-3]MCX2585645.1 hypothetical protein [Pedobacter sp. MR22-3]